jgi:hypothetical protein
VQILTHTVDTEAQQATSALWHGQQVGEVVSMATGRDGTLVVNQTPPLTFNELSEETER